MTGQSVLRWAWGCCSILIYPSFQNFRIPLGTQMPLQCPRLCTCLKSSWLCWPASMQWHRGRHQLKVWRLPRQNYLYGPKHLIQVIAIPFKSKMVQILSALTMMYDTGSWNGPNSDSNMGAPFSGFGTLTLMCGHWWIDYWFLVPRRISWNLFSSNHINTFFW